ncbi:glycosyltransferase [Nitrospirillum viridazoti]|uniref:Glycosyl transferase n=1 Tax=Nitrospirillum viridazoti CBAmc TaxID=1441467 RepID=A0A248K2H7_9PROT|nr:glycosyltransferase [Nitrospirillum amazonense]ASG25050.1 glycosyl transferase [Nitrospirillum amazonense CBAmc]TWB31196.1 UDP:flavonoid glycosyltransferase YjiC (YdhE family) [Nitrospirillum amazonense]
MTRPRIVFVAPPFAGHLYPLLELAMAAQAAGYRVEVITGAAKLPSVTASGLTASALPCLSGVSLERIVDTNRAVGGNPLRLLKQLRASLEVAVAARDQLLALWRVAPPDLVVADSVAVSAGLAAQALGIGWITTIATPFTIENRRGVPCYMGGWTEGSGLGHRLRDAAGRILTRMAKRGMALAVSDLLSALGSGVYREDGTEACYSPRSILGFGLTELEFNRDWPLHFQMIGPVFANPEVESPAPPLASGRPNVLVSLGTHLPWAKKTLAADMAWFAAQRPDLHFVATLGHPERMDEAAIYLARNAVMVPFLSYRTHLGCFDAVIHHGGAGISYAAISLGRPAIVVPHDYDQFDYAARIVAKGAGLRVRRLRSPEMLAALDGIMAPDTCPGLSALAAAAAGYDPHAAFLEVVDSMTGG